MKVCACGDAVEADRASWADTCWACSAMGCGAQWKDGKPVQRCDGCDCLPPAGHVRVVVCGGDNLDSAQLGQLADWIKGELSR